MSNMMRAVLRSVLVVTFLAGGAAAAEPAVAGSKPAAPATMKAHSAKSHHKAKTKKARKAKRRHKAHAKPAE
jgi:hypothetical protein